MEHQTVSIIGGGIAGLTTAIALKKIGITAHVFEASVQILPVGAGLGLGINAMMAFKELGFYDDVMAKGRRIPSFSIYNDRGGVITKTAFEQSPDVESFSIHRAELHRLLLSKLDPATIHYGKQIKTFEITDFAVRLMFEDGSTHVTNYLIVADGIHSVVRQGLVPAARARYAGYTCWRAVIDRPSLNIDESSETWGPNGRFGIVPLEGDKLYWFACVNAPANEPALRSWRVSDLRHHFAQYHAPIPEILSRTADCHLIHNDIIDIAPLSQFAFGRIVLMGDAAHATTPNMGQGACQAIEDAVVMAQCMARDDDYEQAFKTFEGRRLERTKWITDTSRQIGMVAQIENRLLIALRNTALRAMPASSQHRQQKKIAHVDFVRTT